MKRKVVDDIVRKTHNSGELYSNEKFKQMKITETMRVSDKRESTRLIARKIPASIMLIQEVQNAYGTIATSDAEGIIALNDGRDIVVPINNLRILKAILYCNVNPNEEFSSALSEVFMYVLKQTLNRKMASTDDIMTSSGTELQIIVKKELMDFYVKECS